MSYGTEGQPEKGKPPEFLDWYEATARLDARMVWDKAKEYGDIYVTRAIVSSLFNSPCSPEHVFAILAGLKINRIVEALGHGVKPSEDSWRDLACYAMIARRVRQAGAWPA